MKRLALAACLLASATALAQEAPPTLELPTALVVSIRQYLAARPYGEVSDYINTIAACVSVEVPQNGVTRDTGQCPAVSAAIKGREAAASALREQVAALTKERDEAKAAAAVITAAPKP
jgi:hypothetical protein